MIWSMTGWGKAACEFEKKKVTVEIKSLNSKQLDLAIRLPAVFREKELEVRNLVSEKLVRGKIDMNISVESVETNAPSSINKEVFKQYYSQMKEVASELGLPLGNEILPALLRMPDILLKESEEEIEHEFTEIRQAISEALDQLIAYRTSEGKALEEDFIKRIHLIEEMIPEAEAFESQRVNKIRERINNSLSGINGADKIDPNRFEQEIIYYLEKIDITEEKVRLKNNCAYFREVCRENGGNGKKLGFVAQEIGREINTLGSKANDSDIQRVVVRMKDELEKVKEQLMNIL